MAKIFFGAQVDEELKKEFKTFCVTKNIKMAEAVVAALRLWLKEQEGRHR